MATDTNFDFADAEKFYAPVLALNELALNKAGMFVEMQSRSFQKYSTIILDNLKKASEVKDYEESVALLQNQAQVNQQVFNELVEDFKEVSELGKSYVEEARQVVATFTHDVKKPAAKKSAAKAEKK